MCNFKFHHCCNGPKQHKSVSSKRLCPNSDSRHIGNLRTAVVCVYVENGSSSVLPGLCFVQAFVGDGHYLLQNIPNVLLRLTERLLLPHRVRVADVGLLQTTESGETRHHSGLVIHTFKENSPFFPPSVEEYTKQLACQLARKVLSMANHTTRLFYRIQRRRGVKKMGFVLTNDSHKRRFTFASVCFFLPSFAPPST